MNIENIFKALNEDEMNSALGIICNELERQGYEVIIENIEVTSEEIYEKKLPSLEELPEPLNIELVKNGEIEQKFAIDFTDYHKIIFKEFIRR